MTAWSTFKSQVISAYNEGAQSTNREAAAVQAVADFVKARILREVDGDLQQAKSYENSYLEAKVRLAGYTMTSNFATTKTGVQTRITVDASRTAISSVVDLWIQQGMDDLNGTKSIYDAALIEAVIDLQRYIDNYRNRHTTFYQREDFDEYGTASIAQMPCNARPYRFVYQTYYPLVAENVPYAERDYVTSGAHIYKIVIAGTVGTGQMGSGPTSIDPETPQMIGGVGFLYIEHPPCFHAYMTSFPWANREDLSCNHSAPSDAEIADYVGEDFLGLRSNLYAYSLEPRGRSFWVWPRVLDHWQVQVEWDGIKTEFDDADEEMFDVAEARAVAYYIRSTINRFVGNDAESNRFMQLYTMERRKLWIQQEEKKTTLL